MKLGCIEISRLSHVRLLTGLLLLATDAGAVTPENDKLFGPGVVPPVSETQRVCSENVAHMWSHFASLFRNAATYGTSATFDITKVVFLDQNDWPAWKGNRCLTRFEGYVRLKNTAGKVGSYSLSTVIGAESDMVQFRTLEFSVNEKHDQ